MRGSFERLQLNGFTHFFAKHLQLRMENLNLILELEVAKVFAYNHKPSGSRLEEMQLPSELWN